MKRKTRQAESAPDLFSLFGAGDTLRQTPAPPLPQVVKAPPSALKPPPSRAIQECRFDGKDYKIEKHKDEGGEFVSLFVWDAGDWRQLSLLDGDAKYIPEMLFYHAEQMMDWSTGYTDRTRELVAKLRPRPKDDNIAL